MEEVSQVKLEGSLYNVRDEQARKTMISRTNPVIEGSLSVNRKEETAVGNNSVTLNTNNSATGEGATATGFETNASGDYSFTQNFQTIASGSGSHAEGYKCEASGDYSHAEGWITKSKKVASHSEGYLTNTTGPYAHAEGSSTIASGQSSHTEGSGAVAAGHYSHAEGIDTKVGETAANGTISGETTGTQEIIKKDELNLAILGGHAEGVQTKVLSSGCHAEGVETQAGGVVEVGDAAKQQLGCHAEGYRTIAGYDYQTVCGFYNDNKNTTVFEVGNGVMEQRNNAFEVYKNGDAKIHGNLYIDVGKGESGQMNLRDLLKDIKQNNFYISYHNNETFDALHEPIMDTLTADSDLSNLTAGGFDLDNLVGITRADIYKLFDGKEDTSISLPDSNFSLIFNFNEEVQIDMVKFVVSSTGNGIPVLQTWNPDLGIWVDAADAFINTSKVTTIVKYVNHIPTSKFRLTSHSDSAFNLYDLQIYGTSIKGRVYKKVEDRLSSYDLDVQFYDTEVSESDYKANLSYYNTDNDDSAYNALVSLYNTTIKTEEGESN